MEILIWAIVLAVSIFALVKAAHHFTEYSTKLGLALGVSSFIIGATVVAIGTSLPELVTSLYAVIKTGATEFVADTIIGSNIANALLILGIAALVAKNLKIKTSLISVDLPFFFLSAGLFTFFAWDKVITWPEALFLLVLFIIFVIYTSKADNPPEDKDEMSEMRQQFKNGATGKQRALTILKYLGMIIVSATVVAFASKYLIDSLLNLSELIGISSTILTVSVVALGTSLPEILTSIMAIRVGNHAMAFGNVFGSNTFNLLLIGGVPALVSSLEISNLAFTIGLPFLIIATFAAIFAALDNKIHLWEGIAMIFLYLVFLGKIIGII